MGVEVFFVWFWTACTVIIVSKLKLGDNHVLND